MASTGSGNAPRVRRWWTEAEDQILRQEADKQLNQGALKDWNQIAAKLPGRTNKDCRKRWSKVCEQVNKGAWSADEDKRLESAVQMFGKKWTYVAAVVGTRHSDQCAKRWQHSLDPNLDHGEWTPEDDDRLLAAVAVSGRNWKAIGEKRFPARSATDIKNRYVIVDRKRRQALAAKATNQNSQAGTPPPSATSTEDTNTRKNSLAFSKEHTLDFESYESPFSNDALSISNDDLFGSSLHHHHHHQSLHHLHHKHTVSDPSSIFDLNSLDGTHSSHSSSVQEAGSPAPSASTAATTPLSISGSNGAPPLSSTHSEIDALSSLQFNSSSSFHGTTQFLSEAPLDFFSSSTIPGATATVAPTWDLDNDSLMLDSGPGWNDFPTSASRLSTATATNTSAAFASAIVSSPTPTQEWTIGGGGVGGESTYAHQHQQQQQQQQQMKTMLVLEDVQPETLNAVIASLLKSKTRVKMRLFTAEASS